MAPYFFSVPQGVIEITILSETFCYGFLFVYYEIFAFFLLLMLNIAREDDVWLLTVNRFY